MWEWGGQLGSWKHLGFGLHPPAPQVGPGREVWGGAQGGARKQLLDLSQESLF